MIITKLYKRKSSVSALSLNLFYCIFFTILISSCTRREEPYNKPGFDSATLPTATSGQYPAAPSRVAPDYYYRQTYPQQQPYNQQYQQPPQYQAPQYQQDPQPQQQYRKPNYPAGPGGSKSYSNPYAIPPSTQYPYYDGDQYYVPPTYYNEYDYGSEQEREEYRH